MSVAVEAELSEPRDVVKSKRVGVARRYLTVTCKFDLDELVQDLDVGPTQDWQRQAACLGAGPSQFFPERGGEVMSAKRACVGCGVRRSCLVFALTKRERHGIWGGMAERQRRRVRRALDDLGINLPKNEPRRTFDEGRTVMPMGKLKTGRPAKRRQEEAEPVLRPRQRSVVPEREPRQGRAVDSGGREELTRPTTFVPPLFSDLQRQTVRMTTGALHKVDRVRVVASRSDVDRIAAGTAAVLDIPRVLLVVTGLHGVRLRLEQWRAVWATATTVVIGNKGEELGDGAAYAPTVKRLLVAAGPDEALVVVALSDLSVITKAITTGMPAFGLVVVDDVGWMLQEDPGAVAELADGHVTAHKVFVTRLETEAEDGRFGEVVVGRAPSRKAS